MKQPHHFWATIAVFDEPRDAQALVDLFRAEGVECRLQDQRNVQKFWFCSRPQAGINVQVVEEEFGKVKDTLIDNPKFQNVFRNAIRCPSCNSSRVQYPQMTRKFILPTLVAQALVLFGVMPRECYCEDCHYTWPRTKPQDRAVPAGKPNPVKV